MGGPRVRLIERLEIDHPLVRGRRLRQTSLFHQRVAQQRVIENEFPLRDQRARDGFGFRKAVKLVQRVAAQEQSRGIAGVLFVEAGRDAFGQRVVPGIVGHTRSDHELVAELFENFAFAGRLRGACLQIGNRAIDRPAMAAGCKGSLAGRRRRTLGLRRRTGTSASGKDRCHRDGVDQRRVACHRESSTNSRYYGRARETDFPLCYTPERILRRGWSVDAYVAVVGGDRPLGIRAGMDRGSRARSGGAGPDGAGRWRSRGGVV